jgi:hypothetical protein
LLGAPADVCEAAALDVLSVKRRIVDEVFTHYLDRLNRGPERQPGRPRRPTLAMPAIVVMPAGQHHPAITGGHP